jgi:hypothetical protein
VQLSELSAAHSLNLHSVMTKMHYVCTCNFARIPNSHHEVCDMAQIAVRGGGSDAFIWWCVPVLVTLSFDELCTDPKKHEPQSHKQACCIIERKVWERCYCTSTSLCLYFFDALLESPKLDVIPVEIWSKVNLTGRKDFCFEDLFFLLAGFYFLQIGILHIVFGVN